MEKKIPQRMCISCREMKNKKELIRVAYFNGSVSMDTTGKAPGRGAYVCANKDCIIKALKNKLFDKCFDTTVDVSDKDKLLESLMKVI